MARKNIRNFLKVRGKYEKYFMAVVWKDGLFYYLMFERLF